MVPGFLPSHVPVAAPSRVNLGAVRRDPAAREVVLAWRRLTSGEGASGRVGPGEATLVACSGGADSSALVLALAASAKPGRVIVAHVVHDMRPAAESLADRDAARELAAAVGAPFVEASVRAREAGGNLEAASRRLRYAALARLARDRGVRCVATAHHGGDQVESVLMGLLRGSGPRGLGGVAPSRWLDRGRDVRLVRPMLGVGRADCERICRVAGWVWREDTTNADRTRLRSALRHGVARELAALRPGSERRVAAAAEVLRDAAGVVADRAAEVLAAAERREGHVQWERARLAKERAVVVGEALRMAAGELLGGERGMDRLTLRAVGPVVRAIRGAGRSPREFQWKGIGVRVTARAVTVWSRDEHG